MALAVLIRGHRGEQSDFELAADGGDGSAQLVRHVGRELAHLLEAGFQALDHSIEGEDQVIEFVAGIARGNTQAQVGAGNALRGLRYGEHRCQRAARHVVPQQRAEQQRARNHGGEDPRIGAQCLDVIRIGCADRDIVRRRGLPNRRFHRES